MLARYVIAALCARLADEGARVTIVLLALARTGSASAGGLLVAALMIPHVAAAPLAGATADVVRRRKPVYLTAFSLYGVLLAGSALLIGGLSSLLGELAGVGAVIRGSGHPAAAPAEEYR